MNLKFKIKDKFAKGFTLIEVMVAVSIFAIVMMVAMGAVISIVGANKKAQALNSVINNVNFAIESMVRDLRTGEDYNGMNYGGDICDGNDCPAVRFSSTLYGRDILYGFDSTEKKIIQRQYGGGGGSDDNENDFTSGDVQINDLHFYVSEGNNNEQPRILITLKAGSKSNPALVFNIQTMVSQRKLNIVDGAAEVQP